MAPTAVERRMKMEKLDGGITMDVREKDEMEAKEE